MTLGVYRIFLIVFALVVTAALVAALEFTRFGAQVRAAVDNQRMARGLGINVDGAFAITFALGSGLAGLGGALAIDIVGLDPSFALAYLVYVLIVVAVGGLGSIGGTFAAAMLLGISDMAGKYYFPAIGSFLIYLVMLSLLMWRPAGIFGRRSMTVASPALAGPHQHLEAQVRWRTIEIVFWLATLLPFVVTPDYLVLASQIAITALFALSLDLILGYAGIVSLGHAAFFGFGAYTAGLISKWGWGEPLTGLVDRGHCRGPARLSDELHHRALPASGADHDHARLRAPAARSRQQRELAHRRRRRPAGREDVAAARHVQVRSLRLHRLLVRADRAVRVLPGEPAADQLAVRAVAARHPRERGPHARDRRGKPRRTSARSTPSPPSWPASPARC